MSKEKPKTKLCKHCKSEIPKDAKVCPNCRKKQGGILKWIFIVIIAIFIISGITGGGDKNDSTDIKSSEVQDSAKKDDSASKKEKKKEDKKNKKKTKSEPTVAEEPKETEEPAATGEPEASSKAPEKVLEENTKNSINFDITFSDKYRNDKTGNWRLARIAENIDFEEYALDYYNNYFKSDDEVHIIVNFTRNTTTRINVLSGTLLDVTTMDYVDGEEHDAALACSGTMLSEYQVDIQTGEIEKIQ